MDTPSQNRSTFLRAKAACKDTVRRFFKDRGYLEIDTPPLTTGTCIDVHIDPLQTKNGDQLLYLRTSPELAHKRLLAEGYEKIFELGYVFRREEIGPQHEPCFLMLEWYEVGLGYDAMMKQTEELILQVADTLRTCQLLCSKYESLNRPFPRLTVERAYQEYAKKNCDALSEDDFFYTWVNELEPALCNYPALFLHDFPIQYAALAREKPQEKGRAERFELLLGGQEICNGYGELCDARVQRMRFEEAQKTRALRGAQKLQADEWFLRALETGMPDASGNALGFERLIATLMGRPSLHDVVAFSHAKENI